MGVGGSAHVGIVYRGGALVVDAQELFSLHDFGGSIVYGRARARSGAEEQAEQAGESEAHGLVRG